MNMALFRNLNNLRTALWVALCLLSTSCMHSASAETINASKNNVTRELSLSSYDEVVNQTSQDIEITIAEGTPSARLVAPDNVIDNIVVEVAGDKLIFRTKVNTSITFAQGTSMTLYLTLPFLEKASIAGSGNIVLKSDIINQKDFDGTVYGSGELKLQKVQCQEAELNIYGSGNITCTQVTAEELESHINGSGNISVQRIDATKVKARIAGSGNITLKGTTDKATLTTAGSGNIEALNLEAQQVSAKVAGSGNILCNAVKVLDVIRAGSGEIGYKGSPVLRKTPKSGLKKL